MLKSPAGSYSVVTDPAGVAFCLWQAEERRGPEVITAPNAWAMSSLHCPDPENAAKFYSAMFGWEIEAGPAFARCRFGGRVVAVISGTGPGLPPHWAVVFAATDVVAVAARAVELGGKCLVPPMNTPEHRGAVLIDPQGGVFSITTPGVS